jgi:hypothetical protein
MIRFTGFLGVLGSVENMSGGSFSYFDTLSLYDTFLLVVEKVIGDITKLLVVISDDGIRMIMDYSEDFDMGLASGHFTYIEDPDGTLIEFVETHKIPISNKLNICLNLMKRDRSKPMPTFFFQLMKLNRVKFD